MGRLSGIAIRDAKRAPMQTLDSACVTRDSGVADDFRGRPGKRQVTVLSSRAWHAACADLGETLPWTTRRSNLLVDDMDLPQRVGDVIAIGAVRMVVTMEVDPCSRMDEQVPGLRDALSPDWRGGVACTVLSDGDIAVGDAVSVEPAG